ncbi:MAG: hypothetical protein V7K92_11095, partial [Nostoc sp.]|uniref:hypothetical protein n=1 Tax=Nostoc sp. TaxID=1180 RepID=UPI002FF0E2A4
SCDACGGLRLRIPQTCYIRPRFQHLTKSRCSQLDEAGVEVTTVQYNGMIHDFGLLNGLAELPETRSLFVQAAAQLKKHLQ